jgi:regulator of nucleoside diphosphate kinase
MNTLSAFPLSPEIVIGRQEHRTLMRMALGATDDTDDAMGLLLYELERAMVVADDALPYDVVRIRSVVTFETESGRRTMQLVYPKDADISLGKVSVLTPVGTALIGLRTGQSISWRTRDGRRQALTVRQVLQPPRDEPEPPAAA